jgi:glycerophosphoryl diester phosphodiesterase
VPFDRQPVQGFSAVHDRGDGTFLVLCDNGYAKMENSADFVLRVYAIRPDFRTAEGGTGSIEVLGCVAELRDPDGHVPFAITNHFTEERVLTGADFDVESFQVAPDGTLWIGDEFGPFLLHASADGRLLEPPYPLPDAERAGKEIRSPQNPFYEEASTVRVLNAVQQHAMRHGSPHRVICSPDHLMLADGDDRTRIKDRPPSVSSEIHDVESIRAAGFAVIPYTINDPDRMKRAMELGVSGIISDAPDLLYQAVADFDADGDGVGGDLMGPDGLIDPRRFDAQGHRGARDLRPENTLPAMEAALDCLMPTLEVDCAVTAEQVPVLGHEHVLEAKQYRRADGGSYEPSDELLIRNTRLAVLRSQFIGDGLRSNRPRSRNDLELSPVSVAFAERRGLHPYAIPTLEDLFRFTAFYADYYRSGPGRDHADQARRARNAARVRFNVETKRDPEHPRETVSAETFARSVANVIRRQGLEDRAVIQSFDWSTLLVVHREFPRIGTVCLMGDRYGRPGPDGPSPWLAGLPWPHHRTTESDPPVAQTSGGFEGMALSADRRTLLPMLEKPIAGDTDLLIHAFDLERRRYTGSRFRYAFDDGTAIGCFISSGPYEGLVIERDSSQGTLDGCKRIYRIRTNGPGQRVTKQLVVDLLDLADPAEISRAGAREGDVGIGARFAFPFWTIESVVILGPNRLGVLNDNNFPFSVGRHVGTGDPDPNEFIVVELDAPVAE